MMNAGCNRCWSGVKALGMVVIMVAGLFACARPATLYLSLGRDLDSPPAVVGDRSTVSIQPFAEEFATEDQVGHQYLTSGEKVTVKAGKGSAAHALDLMIQQELWRQGAPARINHHDWDLSVAGLGQFPDSVQYVIGGRINKFWIESTSKMVYTEFKSSMELVCVIGLVQEKKIIERTVQVSSEVVKVTDDAKTMDEVANACLRQAAKETVQKLPFVNYR